MTAALWLAGAVVAGAAALVVALPVLRTSRARRDLLEQEQRYLAWRGRARERAGSSLDAYEAARERRRLIASAVLAAAAVACLVAFFVAG